MFLWKREPVCFCESRNSRSASGKSKGTWLKNSTLPRSSWSQCHGACFRSYLLTSTIAEPLVTAVINILQSFVCRNHTRFIPAAPNDRKKRGRTRTDARIPPYCYWPPFLHRAPSVIDVSSPAEAVINNNKAGCGRLSASCLFSFGHLAQQE